MAGLLELGLPMEWHYTVRTLGKRAMPHFTHKFFWARCLAISLIAPVIPAPVRAQDNNPGAALAQARLQYEEKLQAIRDEVLEKIGIKQAALRAKSKPKLEEIAELETARTAFTTSGQWPTFRNFSDSQTKLRKAAKSLDEAYARAETNYLKSGHDDAAKSVRAEHEQFLKECDVASWGHNFVGHWKDDQRLIGPVCKTIDIGAFTSGPYRMELIAHAIEGDGSLSLGIPVPGKKRIDLTTFPADDGKVSVFLSIREFLIGADCAVARPVSTAMKDDETPNLLVLGANGGRIRLESLRFKPILYAADGDLAYAAKADSTPATPIATGDDAEVILPRRSMWRGYGWHGQNPNDLKSNLISNATLTVDKNGRVELQTNGWDGCSQTWVLQLRGKRLHLGEIHSTCVREFTEVQGEGTLDDENLFFRSSSRVAGHSVNTIVYSKFELTRIVDE